MLPCLFFVLFILLAGTLPGLAQLKNVRSYLEIFDLSSGKRQVIFQEDAHFEAPNWNRDGQYFLINSNGKLYRISRDGTRKTLLPTGFADRCNNDHGFSPDGKYVAISHADGQVTAERHKQQGTSRVYVLPVAGGTPQARSPETPSYWHGWSPDGQTLAYVAHRDTDYDIYTVPAAGGPETRLTTTPGLDDGPDYSPDGRYIYFNSYRTGHMQLWRMRPDGSQPEQLTADSLSNWFPHPSPDGRWLVFISYHENQGENHPAMKAVSLRLYDLHTRKISTLCSFTGGQGTLNVPSWSPDGRQFAFVSYTVLPQ